MLRRETSCAVALVILLLAGFACAAKTTYIATNHRFNYVKLKEVKSSVAEQRAMTHPEKIDVEKLRAALTSIKLSRRHLIKEKIDTQRVFSDSAVSFLAPNLARAFEQASPMEEVVFSYLQKNPIFILRNDRINIAQAWMHDNKLHIKFLKLYAKLIGDTDKRGTERRAINRATGLRIDLELGPGQQMGITDSEELVLDLGYDFAAEPEIRKALAGESSDDKPGPAASSKGTGAKDAAAAPAAAAAAPTGVKERLEMLEELKKEKLITEKEYQQKRKEILNAL